MSKNKLKEELNNSILIVSVFCFSLIIMLLYWGVKKEVLWVLIAWVVFVVFLTFGYFLDVYFSLPREFIKDTVENVEGGSCENFDSLISIIVHNEYQSGYAVKLLTKLEYSQAIDLFCQQWAKKRHKKLTKILLKARYIATQPEDIRVLTALKVGKIQACIDQNPKLVKWLLSAFEDPDFDIASRAKQYAISLTNQFVIDELFNLSIENSHVAYIACQCICEAKYQSSNTIYKTLFYFLRDEWTAYDDLDFDQAILRKLYQSVSPELRKKIAEKARKRGWTEWLKIAKKSREKMTPEEWEITISILKNNRELDKMWQLVKESPIWVAQKLLVILSKYSYQPSSDSDVFYQPLLLLANQCPTIKITEINTKNKSQPLFSAHGYYEKNSHNRQFLITSTAEETKVWRIADGQLFFSAHGSYKEISPDWQFLVTSCLPIYSYNNTFEIKVWRIANGQLFFSAEGIYQEISPDWQFLITSTAEGTKVLRIADGQLFFSAKGSYKEISPDWQFLVTYDSTDKETKVWRITNGQLLCSAKGEHKKISPDWQFLVTYNSDNKNPKVWRITNGQLFFSTKEYYQEISPDWQFLVTYDSTDKETKVWRIANGQLLCSAKEIYREISPDWQFLVTYDSIDKETKVWRIANGQLLCSAKGYYKEISPDSQFLVTYDYSTGKETKVWRIANGQLLCSAKGEHKKISPDWQFLVTYNSDNKNPKVWRITNGQLFFSAKGYYKEINPDLQFLITSTDKETKVWRITNGQLFFSAKGYYKEISPDLQFLVTYDSTDKNPKVWRIADGQLLFSAQGLYKEISPDWQFLITSDSDNKNPKVWRIADDQLLFSAQGLYKEISTDWQFLVTYNSDNKNPKVWRTDLVNIESYFLHKFTDQLTIQDMNLIQYLRNNQVSNYVYPMVTEEQKPWLDLMIKLAEYNLSFDVDITEDSPTLEMSDFDIEIEG